MKRRCVRGIAFCILCAPLFFNGCSSKPTPETRTTKLPSASATPTNDAAATDESQHPSPDKSITLRTMYYDRDITASDLAGRGLRELSLIRNTIFARAGNTFRKDWLREYFTSQSWYKPLDRMDASKITPLDKRNAEFIARFEAEIPRSDLTRRRDDLLRKAADKRTPADRIELQLLAAALGEPNDSADAEQTPLDTPAMLDQQLTVDQLSNYSRRDLRLLRNMIYARRGRIFKSPILQEYFERTSWYKADPNYSDDRLTDLDRRNAKLIQSVEAELGGGLTDAEMADWFGGA